MNSTEAKQILIACRPGSEDLRSPEARAAIELVQRDPELRAWWEQHEAFQNEARRAFRDVPVPSHLRDKLLARAKTVEVPFWRRPIVWSAAAAVLIFLGALSFWKQPSAEDSFATFRSRMVQSVLRQYRMDIMTNDMGYIRQYLASRQAPANYKLPPGLERLPAMGAGVLSWQDRKVSMVCLDSGEKGTLFLFVVDKESVQNPPKDRMSAMVKELDTVAWTEAGEAYVLVGPGGKEWLNQVP